MHEHRESIPTVVVGLRVHHRNLPFLGDLDRLVELRHVAKRSNKRRDNGRRLAPLMLHGVACGHLLVHDLGIMIARAFEATVDARGVVCHASR